MHKFHALFVAMITALLIAPPTARAQATTFKVDGVHSAITFKIMHVGVSNTWGRFNMPEGSVVWDNADPSRSSINVTVQAANIDTGNKKRDDHLRSPDFFNARQFPTINFKSKSVTKKSDTEFEVAGDLSLHGVTKPITATVTKVGEGDRGPQLGYRGGWETTFTVKRSEFGMNFMPDGIGDEVTLFVSIEGIKG